MAMNQKVSYIYVYKCFFVGFKIGEIKYCLLKIATIVARQARSICNLQR